MLMPRPRDTTNLEPIYAKLLLPVLRMLSCWGILLFIKRGHSLKYQVILVADHGFNIKQCRSSEMSRPPDNSAYWKIIFFISHPKHMLWVLKRTVSLRRFF